MAGGYADSFSGAPTQPGSVFANGGADGLMGFPETPIPPHTFPFQTNASGALFHVTTELRILYPDADSGRFRVLGPLPPSPARISCRL